MIDVKKLVMTNKLETQVSAKEPKKQKVTDNSPIKECVSKGSCALKAARLDKIAELYKKGRAFLSNLETHIKKDSPESIHKRLHQIAKDRSLSRVLLDNYPKIKDLPYVDKLLEAVVKENPKLVLWYSNIYKEKQFIKPILVKLIKKVKDVNAMPKYLLSHFFKKWGEMPSIPEVISFRTALIKRLIDLDPTKGITLYPKYNNFPEANSILKITVGKMLNLIKGVNKKSSLLACFRKCGEMPNIPEVISFRTALIKRIINIDPTKGITLYAKYKDLPRADLILKATIDKMLNWAKGENKAEAIEVIMCVLDKNSYNIPGPGIVKFREQCRDILMTNSELKNLLPSVLPLLPMPSHDPLRDRIENFITETGEILKGYKEAKTQADKENYMHGNIAELSPKLHDQLKEFNSHIGISLRPISLLQFPFEFVFINTWENPKDKTHFPVRIALSLDELKGSKAIEIIKKQYKDEATSEQTELWEKRGFDFDLPKNGKTSFMLASVPRGSGENTIKGTEIGMAKIADMYRAQYGAKWEGVLMQDLKAWKTALYKGKSSNAPENIEPTKKNILTSLRNNLIKAIDSGQEMFLFQYLMHGVPKIGKMRSSSGLIDAEEYAAVLSEVHNGKPLSAQIQITLVIESCFGGGQLDKIIDHLRAKKTPVKGLHIVSGSQRETTYKVPTINTRETFIVNYLTYYFERIEQRRLKGETIKPPLGTMGHAIAFVDNMQKGETKGYLTEASKLALSNIPDSSKFTDLQGYYYSTEKPIKNPEPASPPKDGEEKREEPKGYYFSEKQTKDSDEGYA